MIFCSLRFKASTADYDLEKLRLHILMRAINRRLHARGGELAIITSSEANANLQ